MSNQWPYPPSTSAAAMYVPPATAPSNPPPSPNFYPSFPAHLSAGGNSVEFSGPAYVTSVARYDPVTQTDSSPYSGHLGVTVQPTDSHTHATNFANQSFALPPQQHFIGSQTSPRPLPYPFYTSKPYNNGYPCWGLSDGEYQTRPHPTVNISSQHQYPQVPGAQPYSPPSRLVNLTGCSGCGRSHNDCRCWRPMGPNLVGRNPYGMNTADQDSGEIGPEATVSRLPRNAGIYSGSLTRTGTRRSIYQPTAMKVRKALEDLKGWEDDNWTWVFTQISNSVDQLMAPGPAGESAQVSVELAQNIRNAQLTLSSCGPWVPSQWSSTVKRLATELGILTDLMGHFLQSQELSVPEASVSGPISSAPAYPVVPPPPGRAPGEDSRKPFSNLM